MPSPRPTLESGYPPAVPHCLEYVVLPSVAQIVPFGTERTERSARGRVSEPDALPLHKSHRGLRRRATIGLLLYARAGFSAAHLLLPPVQLVLRNILENTTPILAPPEIHDTGDIALLSLEDQAKRTLLRSVVVVSVNDPQNPTRRILEFATPVHRRFWFREAYPSTITVEDFNPRVNNIDTWLSAVLSGKEGGESDNQR